MGSHGAVLEGMEILERAGFRSESGKRATWAICLDTSAPKDNWHLVLGQFVKLLVLMSNKQNAHTMCYAAEGWGGRAPFG